MELIGRASTSVWIKNKLIGRNVNAAAYYFGEGVKVFLESNSEALLRCKPVCFESVEAYEDWKDEQDVHLMLAGIRLFGGKTSFDNN